MNRRVDKILHDLQSEIARQEAMGSLEPSTVETLYGLIAELEEASREDDIERTLLVFDRIVGVIGIVCPVFEFVHEMVTK